MNYFVLSNKVKMPIIGYGVYQISKEECKECVLNAIKAGYRLIDTAQSYFNEEEVGLAIKESKIKREEIFITTKVWIQHYKYDDCIKSIEQSLKKLQVEYIDLVLLHQPFNDYYDAWRALEDLYEQGKIRAIGVSNFYPDRLVDLCNFARIKPMVNQIETHPLYQRKIDNIWMKKYQVQHFAWASFCEGRKGIFNNETLLKIATKHHKTTAQVMLKWAITSGIGVIPKTTHFDRMKENLDIFDFELDQEDLNQINSLDTNTSSFFSHQDPQMVEWFVKMIEERKTNQDYKKENKNW